MQANYPEESIQQSENGEILKSRGIILLSPSSEFIFNRCNYAVSIFFLWCEIILDRHMEREKKTIIQESWFHSRQGQRVLLRRNILTGSGAQTTSCSVCTGGCFLAVNSPGHEACHSYLGSCLWMRESVLRLPILNGLILYYAQGQF